MTRSEREKERQARSFGAAAEAYERGRPPYPADAVAWLVPADARTVVDLGAGTGKLTRLLPAPGRTVVAVEPSAGMRAEFARVLPQVPLLAGTAESIPMPAGSVDALVCAQAWHWVEPHQAFGEAARVLRPGGQLGVVWNDRDATVPWVAALDRLLRHYAAAPTEDRQLDQPEGPFSAVSRHDVQWRHPMAHAEIADMIASRSYVVNLEPAAREELLDRVRELLAAENPAEMPYVTRCFRTRRG